jgi:Rhodanese-like domain
MANRKTNEPPPEASPKNAILILTLGCLVVAGLVVWALTRTVEPATPPPAAPVADQTAAPLPNVGVTDTMVQPTTTTSPVQISIDGGPPQTVPASNTPAPLPTALQPRDPSAVKRIAAEDVREKVNAQSAVIIDVRDAASFAQGHIPGAINIPFASVQTQMSAIPKGKEIITYCT